MDMEVNENLENLGPERVEDQPVPEAVGQAAETEKTYTQSEVDEMVRAKLDEVLPKKIARTKAKIEKDYRRKYGDLESVLKAGTGKNSVEEVTDTFKEIYRNRGIQLPQNTGYSEQDTEILAKADAEDIIRAGFDEVVEEVDRLTKVGASNMTAREKAVFKTLAEYRRNEEQKKELSKLGVTEDVFDSQEFQDFASKFNSKTPIGDIYDIYRKTKPQKEIRTMGSMKNSTSDDGTVKDCYTRDEALKFTKKDFDRNPALFKAVEQSMLKW